MAIAAALASAQWAHATLGGNAETIASDRKALAAVHRATIPRSGYTTDNIIVETWGHMRNLRGRAYAPCLVPNDVSVDEIE